MPEDDRPPEKPSPSPREPGRVPDPEITEVPTQQYAYVPEEVGLTDDTRGATLPGDRLGYDPDDEIMELLAPGRLVDQYKIVRFLGRGGMSEVYLARDVGLGRKVAIKVLLPRALGSKEAVDRFLFEARATARFSFPHIVAIHAVGEYKGYPYLALEYLEGQTLQDRLREKRPSTQEAVRFGLAIAEALQEAHRNQILHRDLKPANVMLPKDGRLRVVDFGLAKRTQIGAADVGGIDPVTASANDSYGIEDAFQTLTEGIRGTPAYMAPEQWASDPVTGATDVWALGLVLYEMTTGRHPLLALEPLQICHELFRDEPLPSPLEELPGELTELIVRCIDKRPGRRPPIGEVVETLRGQLHGRRAGTAMLVSPFRGLLPLDERHADQFFGRDAEIAAFVERLRWEPVLPVIGPSGSGKSSFVQAGVIPRLQEQGRWLVLRLRPGNRPYLALATRLRTRGSSRWSSAGGRASVPDGDPDGVGSEAERALTDALLVSPASLAVKLGEIAEAEQTRVLLFVDQLEELYTLSADAAQRRAFVEAICLAADDAEGPVRVVFTLREDFLGRLAVGPASRAALGRATVMVTPGPEALEEIVTRTVREAGYDFDDPDLVPQIVEAVRDEAAALPMVQFAGQTLWRRRDDVKQQLLRAVYDEVGGVVGCMAHHAEGLLDALTPSQVQTARVILLRLVTTAGTRRVVARGRLLDGLAPDAGEVLDRLVQGRAVLVRKSGGGGEDAAELELVHESLIQSWTRLSRWIDESREEMAFLGQVEQAVDLWETRGERAEEVWRGEALREARVQLERMAADVPPRVTRFLAAGAEQERRETVRVRTRWAAVIVLVALVGLTTAAAVHFLAGPGRRCANPEQRLAGVWDDAVRAQLHDAFLTVDRPYAGDTHRLLEPILDDYATAWTEGYSDACQATHVRGEQSERVLDLRMACLDRRRAAFAALVLVLTEDVDGELLDQSVKAAYDLTPLFPCADAGALAAAVSPPDDPRVAGQVEEVRAQLDHAAALEKTGRYQAGIDIAAPAALEAEGIDYAPVQAEVLYQLGVLQERQGEYEASEATLQRAAEAAARAHDDRLIARIWVDLVLVVGDRLARHDEGLVYHRLAAVAVTRAGNDPVLEAQLLHNLGNIFLVEGQFTEARDRYTESMEIRVAALGEDHPAVGASLNNLGLAVGKMGEYELSRRHQERALEIKRRSLGPDHPDVAASLNNLGIILTYEKKYDEAVAAYEEAFRILENAFGPGHGDVAMVLNNLGHMREVQGRYDEAWEYHERALVVRREQLGEHHYDVGTSLFNLGVVRGAQGRCDEALALYAEALVIMDEALGAGHPSSAYALSATGQCLFDLGRPADAVGPLQEAERIRRESGTDPVLLVDTSFLLARALWSSGLDRARAVSIAEGAREDLAGSGELHADTLSEIDAWLAGERR